MTTPTKPHDGQLLREPELIDYLNTLPGVSIRRRNFGARIRPMLQEWQPRQVRQSADGQTQAWVYALHDLWQLERYLTVRARRIEAGKWHERWPYRLEDLDAVALLDEHEA